MPKTVLILELQISFTQIMEIRHKFLPHRYIRILPHEQFTERKNYPAVSPAPWDHIRMFKFQFIHVGQNVPASLHSTRFEIKMLLI